MMEHRSKAYTREEFNKVLREFHKQSSRHVLIVEADISHVNKCAIFHYADLLRKAGNELTAVMKKKLDQLTRTKKYRSILDDYNKYKKNDNKKMKSLKGKELKALQEDNDITFDFCRKTMIEINKRYGLNSIHALARAEDVWKGVEKCLYSNGKTLRFKKRFDLPSIRAKQINRGIVAKYNDNDIYFSFDSYTKNKTISKKKTSKIDIHLTKDIDRFQSDELNAILDYLKDPEYHDHIAVRHFDETVECISTYRPCYAALVCKTIRGRMRVFVHITVEGKAVPKYDSKGNPRHKKGTGIVGVDIGTQHYAYVSDKKDGIDTLGALDDNFKKQQQKEKRLKRQMDRKRRANNPQNYDDDGTIKKGRKRWHNSNRYKKTLAKYKEQCRKNAVNRKYANNHKVNLLRELGDIVITEPKNWSKLQKKVKKTKKNDQGKYQRKKRSGKSLLKCNPGYFQEQLKKVFPVYIEVSKQYRASQYDHTADDYIKKKLSQRKYELYDGTMVQRDWYSAFLLYNYDFQTQDIDKPKCCNEFKKHHERLKSIIEDIRKRGIKINNSGIKI